MKIITAKEAAQLIADGSVLGSDSFQLRWQRIFFVCRIKGKKTPKDLTLSCWDKDREARWILRFQPFAKKES